MPTIQAHIPTDRPARYLHQFCKHAAAMGALRARGQHPAKARHERRTPSTQPLLDGPGATQIRCDWTETEGIVNFDPVGRCLLQVQEGILLVRVEAENPEVLQRLRDIVTRDFDRFGRRQLTIEWQSDDSSDAGPSQVAR